MTREILALPEETKLTVLAPLIVHRKGEFKELWDELRGRGFARVRLDGRVHPLDALPAIDKRKKHSVELVVDRLVVRAAERARLAEAVELGLREGKGSLIVERADGGEQRSFSEARACCGVAFPELSPQSFSFNSPLGMCHSCNGLGQREVVDPRLVIPDPSLSIRHGAIAPWAAAMARGEGWTVRIVDGVSRAFDVDLDAPWNKIPKPKQKLVLYGVEGQKIAVRWGKEGSLNSGTWGMRYEGIIKNLERKFHETDSDAARELYRRYLRVQPCESCVSGKTIAEVTHMTVADAAAHVATLELSPSEKAIGEGALREVQSRLTFLLPERRRSSAPPSPSNPTRSWLR